MEDTKVGEKRRSREWEEYQLVFGGIKITLTLVPSLEYSWRLRGIVYLKQDGLRTLRWLRWAE